jgi:hypothetical protein
MINRILYSDNGTLSEWTPELEKFQSGSQTFSLVSAEDAIYIGSLFPFNHKYFKMGATPNAETASIAVKYWDGDEFVDVVNVVDETSVSGASLGQSGFITWTPDEDKLWSMEHTEDITELNTIKIYNMYWTKITFSADLTASVILSWLGQVFSDDDDLGSEFPLLNRAAMLTAFESGKTDWEEQHVKAAEILIKDLIESNVIDNRNQILLREKFKLASVSKCAELAFRGFGDDYADDRRDARQEYNSRKKLRVYMVDKNEDALLQNSEARTRHGFLSR